MTNNGQYHYSPGDASLHEIQARSSGVYGGEDRF